MGDLQRRPVKLSKGPADLETPQGLRRVMKARSVASLEARALLTLVGKGRETLLSIRELISVGEREGKILRAFMQAHPEESGTVRRAIAYRVDVLEAFDRLAAREDYAERIAAAEVEESRREAPSTPVSPSRSELVVAVGV